jgi:hypothetical protein
VAGRKTKAPQAPERAGHHHLARHPSGRDMRVAPILRENGRDG